MAFIANASGFTLRDGTFNNIQGNLVICRGMECRRVDIEDASSPSGSGQASRTRREEGQLDGFRIIEDEHLTLTGQIGCRPGYHLHAGEIEHRTVIVKVFDAMSSARQHWKATVLHSKGLVHSNVLRIRWISSPDPQSSNHFVVYEDACQKTAEGPLADALRSKAPSVSYFLGLKLVAGLSSALNYLTLQHISIPPRAENFVVLFDKEGRLKLCIDPPLNEAVEHRQQEDGFTCAWHLFNTLCQKNFRAANRLLYDEDIERTPVPLDSSSHSTRSLQPLLAFSLPLQGPENDNSTDNEEHARAFPPRREYVWRMVDVQQPLATIADRLNWELDGRHTSIKRLNRRDGRSVHRCLGYIREEITLATRMADSVVVSHDAPSPLEVCPICHEVVHSKEVFRCICDDPNPGLRPTFKCRLCNFWSHSDCVRNPSEAICQNCASLDKIQERASILGDNKTCVSFTAKEYQSRLDPFPTQQGYVTPARSRTGSTAQRRLLRTLSTVSIYESAEGRAGGLADIAPIGRFNVESNSSNDDAPPSEMPRILEDEQRKPKKEGGGFFSFVWASLSRDSQ